jgi:hypothetical protein
MNNLILSFKLVAWILICILKIRIDGEIVSVFALNAVNHGICCFSTTHLPFRNKSLESG